VLEVAKLSWKKKNPPRQIKILKTREEKQGGEAPLREEKKSARRERKVG